MNVRKRKVEQGRTGGRERLLDAAEALFADKGYDGTSMRAITKAAGVELGLANYHFGSKQELFGQVLVRRAPDMAADLGGALAEARAEGSLEAVFAAFARTHLAKLHDSGEGWRNYMRVSSGISMRPQEDLPTSSAFEIYAPVIASYRNSIADARPGTTRDEIDRVFRVFHSAVLALLIGGPVSEGEIDALIATMVRVFARGV